MADLTAFYQYIRLEGNRDLTLIFQILSGGHWRSTACAFIEEPFPLTLLGQHPDHHKRL